MKLATRTTTSPTPPEYSGTVHSYDDGRGYGYIVSDDSRFGDHPLILNRQHLRNPFVAVALSPGQRVLFKPKRESGGFVALDVRLEAEELEAQRESRESSFGVVERTLEARDFGFIRLPDRRRAFFHVSDCAEARSLYPRGTAVRCDLVRNKRGWRALDVMEVDPNKAGMVPEPLSLSNQELLAQATLARDSKDYDRARELYKKGISEDPSVQLVLSYAAFEKNQNNKPAALDVYRKGIRLFPKVAKLREDAGVLAGNMGRTDQAEALLTAALDLCRTTEQAGELGVLLALARLHARGDTAASRRRALHFYGEAISLRGKRALLAHDLRKRDLLEVRQQHHRGDLTYRFLLECGFEVTSANLLPMSTTGADFVVQTENAEIKESYGLSGALLVRCMFKAKLSNDDVEHLDSTMADLVERERVNDQMALIVLSSVPAHLREAFFRRIERRDGGHVIVPIAQEVMETASKEESSAEGPAMGALRGVLDTWLYRRDLFAGAYPVFGKRFFGRERILAQLRDAIATAKPAGIFGLRKVGKTSLLKECERRATASGDIVVYVDLLRAPTGADARWLYWRIAHLLHEQTAGRAELSMKWRLGGRYPDYLDMPDDFPVALAFDSDLSALVRATDGADLAVPPRIAFLLDEIEKILPTKRGEGGFAGFFDFLGYLRGFAQETQRLAVIVAGANPEVTEVSQFDGRDNPVFNFFTEVYLQLLEPDEARTMMQTLGRGMGVRFTDTACVRIVDLTGGHPYFTREFCSFLTRRSAERPLHVTLEKVEAIVDPYLEEVGAKDFQEIMDRLHRDYPDERELYVELARGVKTTAARGSLKHLAGYHLVNTRDKHASLTMDLFRKWILEWT